MNFKTFKIPAMNRGANIVPLLRINYSETYLNPILLQTTFWLSFREFYDEKSFNQGQKDWRKARILLAEFILSEPKGFIEMTVIFQKFQNFTLLLIPNRFQVRSLIPCHIPLIRSLNSTMRNAMLFEITLMIFFCTIKFCSRCDFSYDGIFKTTGFAQVFFRRNRCLFLLRGVIKDG